MSTLLGDEDWMRNMCFDGCPYEESDNSSNEALNVCDIEGNLHDGAGATLYSPNSIGNEIHLGSYSNQRHEEENPDLVSEEEEGRIMCKQFNNTEEAYIFYKEYAKNLGFGVRKHIRRRAGKDNIEVKRQFVCSRQGQRDAKYDVMENRKREPRAITRCGCTALFEVILNKASKQWVVSKFQPKHNHPLLPYPSSMFLRSHRRVNEEDAMLAMSLKSSGVRTCQIMDHFVKRVGDYSSVGFEKTDLYNRIDKERRNRCIDGDANTLIAIMKNVKKEDPGFFYTYEQNESGQLTRLLWADSACRHDYSIFGDLLLFDSTYRSNQFKMPIVVFAGVNNHRQSVVFGFALMTDEITEAYKWELRSFLNAMDGKQPKSVITDGDPAIRAALVSTLPGVVHRLCSWHVSENCIDNVKISGFAQDFCRAMYMKCSVDDFEQKWEEMLNKYKVHDNNWVLEIYKKRERWAEAYLQGSFFAGCRSNQRCEILNSVIRRTVKPGMQITELFEKLQSTVANIRHREHEDEVITLSSKPKVMTHLTEYAGQDEAIYTRASFDVFRKQLEQEALYIIDEKCDDGNGNWTFRLTRHQHRTRKSTVLYNAKGKDAKCSCMLFESYGFPCRHMIAVFKNEHLEQLPLSCILRRWTQNVKSVVPIIRPVLVYEKAESAVRFSELMQLCREKCTWASKTVSEFELFKNLLHSFPKPENAPSTCQPGTQPQVTEAQYASCSSSHEDNSQTSVETPVGNPKVVSSRGRHKKRRRHHNKTWNKKRYSHGSANKREHLKELAEACHLSVQDDLYSKRDEEHNLVGKREKKVRLSKNKCSRCRIEGHNKNKCPLKGSKGQDAGDTVIEDQVDKSNQ